MPTVTSGTALTLPADPTAANLVVLERGREGEVLSGVDVVFPVLHGAYGEDGTIQGLLEMVGLPYAGAGVLSSAVAMDKEFTKKLLIAEGLPVGPYEVLHRGEATLSAAQRDRLGLPVFVKPARAGSSTGITKVTDWSELDGAVATAREIDPKVLVESAIVGSEVECGVLEFPDGRVEASLPAEIRITADGPDWYDFETKYLDDVCELDIPAKLDDAVTERLRAVAVDAFRALDCQGLARVDFFVAPRRLADHQRAQHHAGLHAHVGLPEDVGGHRCRLPDAALHPHRHGRRAGDRTALAVRAHGFRGQRRDGRGNVLQRAGSGAGGHRQCHVDGAVHDVPGGGTLALDRKPPHAGDLAQRGGRGQLVGPQRARSAARPARRGRRPTPPTRAAPARRSGVAATSSRCPAAWLAALSSARRRMPTSRPARPRRRAPPGRCAARSWSSVARVRLVARRQHEARDDDADGEQRDETHGDPGGRRGQVIVGHAPTRARVRDGPPGR